MKILLIEPGVYKKQQDKEFLHKESIRSTRYLALTLPYLAALTPPNIHVDLAYEVSDNIDDYELDTYDLIGITAQTIHMKRTLELARHFKKIGCPVVVGGPITIEDNNRLVPVLARFCTSVIIGEAENTWLEFLEDFRTGTPKTIYKSALLSPLNNLPIPRFELINFDKISKPHVLPSMTSRGCPRRCTFCNEFLYGSWRMRPVSDVIAELTAYKSRFGISKIAFRDDDFLVHPRRSQELLQKMIPLELEWSCQTDLNLARHPSLLELAVKSGMRSVSFGLESVLEENREAIGKDFFTTDEAENVLLYLYENGIETQVNMIFGFDQDTTDVFERAVDFLIRNKVSRFFPSILYPIPGTPIYEQFLKENRLLDTHPPGIEDPLYVGYIPKNMSAQELVQGYQYVFDYFYRERKEPVYWLGEENHIWTESNDIC